LCKPNAGNPVIGDDGIAAYPMTPDEFAAIMADCAKMGATLLGGCCGTAPEYIKAINTH
jgi:5-methyltetrahydrofolate--homocysteine methyltransferase